MFFKFFQMTHFRRKAKMLTFAMLALAICFCRCHSNSEIKFEDRRTINGNWAEFDSCESLAN